MHQERGPHGQQDLFPIVHLFSGSRAMAVGRRMALRGLVVLGLALVMGAGIARAIAPPAPATYTVNSANDVDDGTCNVTHCSLREAINAANAHAGDDSIVFAIGTGSQTIAPTSALPAILSPVAIDGTTQPGFVKAPIIELSGASAGGGVHGLRIVSGPATIRGLVINRFDGHGIFVDESPGGTKIEGNYIGTDATGTADLGNTGSGDPLSKTLSATSSAAPRPARATSSRATTGMASTSSIPTATRSKATTSAPTPPAPPPSATATTECSLIRSARATRWEGGTADARNVISGNGVDGVDVTNGSTGTTIAGNYIGTDAAGTRRPRQQQQRCVSQRRLSGNIVGGTDAGAQHHLRQQPERRSSSRPLGAGHKVEGNYIGIDATGTVKLANYTGVLVTGPTNTIGGTATGAGNVISGNNNAGIRVTGATARRQQGRGELPRYRRHWHGRPRQQRHRRDHVRRRPRQHRRRIRSRRPQPHLGQRRRRRDRREQFLQRKHDRGELHRHRCLWHRRPGQLGTRCAGPAPHST